MSITNGWGLIGAGRIAEDRILPAIKACPRSRLAAVMSRDRARAEACRAKFGAVSAYTSYEAMLADPHVTVVAVHTPNALHAEHAIAAARAGKHVFCDKPLANNAADAARIVKACDEAGVTLAVNFHSRFMPCFNDARRIIASGEIGEPLLVQFEASPGSRSGQREGTWRVDPAIAGLGTSFSIGVHAYDTLRYLLDSEVETVSTFFDTPRGVMEAVSMSTFRFASGVFAHVSVHEKAPHPHNDFVIQCTRGRITGRGLTRSRAGGEMHVLGADGRTRVTEYPAIDAHAACIAAFSSALLEGRAFSPSGLDGLRSAEITDAMARSAWDGVHVTLEA